MPGEPSSSRIQNGLWALAMVPPEPTPTTGMSLSGRLQFPPTVVIVLELVTVVVAVAVPPLWAEASASEYAAMPAEPRSSVMIEPPLVTDVVAVAVPPVLLPDVFGSADA